MEISQHKPGARYLRSTMVPCSYNDYQTATKGELPERYIGALAKII
jgi:formiminoglutamase